MKVSVLTYLVKDNQVCLGMKKVRYGQGKWNGFGGKVNEGESIEDGAAREVREEAKVHIDPANLEKVAEFYYHEDPEDWIVSVFICGEWDGETSETEEMKPEWFAFEKLPLEEMWDNDKLWISRLLTEGEKLKGTFWLDKEGKIYTHDLRKVERI